MEKRGVQDKENGGDSRGNRSGESEKEMFDASRSIAGADGACDAGGEDRRQLGIRSKEKGKVYKRIYCRRVRAGVFFFSPLMCKFIPSPAAHFYTRKI
jgi:hypothetical protein